LLKELLRLEDESYEYFTELEIHELLMNQTEELLDYFKKFYISYSKDIHEIYLPTKLVFENKNLQGDFRVMPCCINEDIKSVKIIGTNEEEKHIKDKICVGKSFLIDKHDNFIYAMFDVCVLSSFRTAVISVLSFIFCSDNSTKTIGIIGAGRIGFYTTYILYKLLNIQNIFLVEINEKIKKNFSELCAIYMPNLQIRFSQIKRLNSSCNTLFLTTNSKEPIINNVNSDNIEFISSVGADAHNLSEISEELIGSRNIISDSKQSTLLGDMKKWIDKKLLDENSVLELIDIIKEPNLLKNKKQLFISTGVAIQDALISKYIYDKLTKNKFRTNN